MIIYIFDYSLMFSYSIVCQLSLFLANKLQHRLVSNLLIISQLMTIKAKAPETAEVFKYFNLRLYFNKQTERTHKVVGRLKRQQPKSTPLAQQFQVNEGICKCKAKCKESGEWIRALTLTKNKETDYQHSEKARTGSQKITCLVPKHALTTNESAHTLKNCVLKIRLPLE